jgi:hypothetical protein
MSGHKKIAYLCRVELQYHGYDKQNLRAAAHGSCTTTRDGTGQAFVGRPGVAVTVLPIIFAVGIIRNKAR